HEYSLPRCDSFTRRSRRTRDDAATRPVAFRGTRPRLGWGASSRSQSRFCSSLAPHSDQGCGPGFAHALPFQFRHLKHLYHLREQIGQSAFIAVLGGFRSVMADLLFIDAYSAWERTDWTYLLLRLRQATELQPRAILFWEMAGWHMAWNAGTAAMEDDSKSPAARRRLQHDYLELGEDFLVRGIAYNPEKPQLYEALARLYRDKFHDHARAAE